MMNTRVSYKPVMKWLSVLLLLALALILFSCSSMSGKEPVAPTADWFHSLRESVLDNVHDKERAKKAIALINQADLAMLQYVSEAEENALRLQKLQADYDATREDFASAFDKADASNRSAREMLHSFRSDLKAVIEPDEWQAFELSRSLIEVHASKP